MVCLDGDGHVLSCFDADTRAHKCDKTFIRIPREVQQACSIYRCVVSGDAAECSVEHFVKVKSAKFQFVPLKPISDVSLLPIC
jgi:hypothetical protein